MHPDYDHFILLTSKSGKFQPQTNVFFLGITTPFSINVFSIKPCVGGQVEISEKNTIYFSSLRSCYHKLANRKNLILPLEKYFRTLNDMIIGTAGTKL